MRVELGSSPRTQPRLFSCTLGKAFQFFTGIISLVRSITSCQMLLVWTTSVWNRQHLNINMISVNLWAFILVCSICRLSARKPLLGDLTDGRSSVTVIQVKSFSCNFCYPNSGKANIEGDSSNPLRTLLYLIDMKCSQIFMGNWTSIGPTPNFQEEIGYSFIQWVVYALTVSPYHWWAPLSLSRIPREDIGLPQVCACIYLKHKPSPQHSKGLNLKTDQVPYRKTALICRTTTSRYRSKFSGYPVVSMFFVGNDGCAE